MTTARLDIDLAAVEHNTSSIVEMCAARGMAVMGVTKGVFGHPDVAAAMVRGGVKSLGDSRLDNIARLRAKRIDVPVALLRAPTWSEIEAVVDLVDLSFQTELATIERIADAAASTGRVHEVVLMVDLGERREGVLPEDAGGLARRVLALPGVRLVGIGTNLTCFSGVEPSPANMTQLVDLAGRIREDTGSELSLVSAGGSSTLPLLAAGSMPAGVTEVRIGEALLLGRETVHHRIWPGTVQDAITVRAEVVEAKDKPPAPPGPRGDRAFGRAPAPSVEGGRRALVAVGRADVDVDGLTPLGEGHRIVGATSDYLVIEVTPGSDRVELGDELTFALDYGALVTATGSIGLETRIVTAKEVTA
jgi:predicted amino acid racemase